MLYINVFYILYIAIYIYVPTDYLVEGCSYIASTSKMQCRLIYNYSYINELVDVADFVFVKYTAIANHLTTYIAIYM